MKLKFDSAVWRKVAGALGLAFFVMLSSLCFGQQLTGTLTGTTYDSTGAVVPNAQITMKNDASGDVRTTVSNGSGYFSITAVQPGAYTITVTATGFKTWKGSGINFAQGDNRNLANISLQVGDAGTSVEVNAGAISVPVDTAEVSTTLEQGLIQNIPIQGRDAGELLKLMPGMALTNGLSNGSAFNDAVVGTNNGPVGAYSSNGTQPNGAMAFMLDGANLTDPGNAGTQIANINQDMVSEVKVLMSSYSAEYAKGPTIFQAFSKSGGKQFHGEGYFYARSSTFNSIDAFTHSQLSPTNPVSSAAPYQSFYYMGGNVGGPIRLPFTSFNKDRNKLFFWAGYEYMKQNPAGAVVNYNVPTPEQFAGDFSNTTIEGIPGSTIVSSGVTLAQQLQSTWGYAYNNLCCSEPAGVTGTSVPSSTWDPNAKAIMGLYPHPNITPSALNGWNNYQYVSQVPQNRWEATGKVDYAISDNSKLSVSYTRQIETDQHPIGVWWTPPWDLPYPSNVVAATTSNEIMSNFTHVFSPTTTNEFVFTYARYINPATLQNPSAVDRSALGFNVTGLFGHTSSQIPNIDGPWGGVFPNIEEFSFDGSFNGGNTFGALKSDPALYDNFTKVVGSHTLKAGFYWDTSGNVQSFGGLQGSPNMGVYNLGWGSNSTGNVVADFLLGRAANYQQTSSFPTQSIQFHQWSIYGQDSYKANRQLTLNYGLRADHIGQMYGPPNGMQVWDPSTYVNGPMLVNGVSNGAPAPPANTGLVWSGIDKNIPNSGLVSPLFYYEPRVGMAYDIFGTGKSVLRAGFAVFRYQFAVNDVGGPAAGPAGAFTFTTPSITSGYAQIDSGAAGFVPPSTVEQNGSSIGGAFRMGDNQVPQTMDWNVTLSQALPWRSIFEVSYVGNKSTNEFLNGANGKLEDINNMAPGTFWLADPKIGAAGAGKVLSPSPITCNNANPNNNAVDCGANTAAYNVSFNSNDYRPLNQYQDIYLITHDSYQNYNSLQASWQKQSGPVTFLTNYTFSKNLGIRDGETSNGAGNGTVVDPFSIKNNYGTLAYDHTHILNFSYVWNLPNFIHGNKFAGGAVNGWQISGYTTYQSGVPLQPNLNGNLNATYASGLTTPLVGAPGLPDNSILLPNGLRASGINPSTWFGTSSINNIMPTLICDPTKHASGLYFNPNCFGMPAYGQQGALSWPNLRGPAYFDSDLGLFKSFKITESQSVQFRVSATNFLNHPISQFALAGNSDEVLNFQSTTPTTSSSASVCSAEGQTINAGTGVCTFNIIGVSPTNTNNNLTGKPAFKNGSRQVTFALKYYF